MPLITPTLTADSLRLFKDIANDAGNWGGTPMVGGNVCTTKADLGNLTDLKKHGLLSTFESDGCYFIDFTPAGLALAFVHGIQIRQADF